MLFKAHFNFLCLEIFFPLHEIWHCFYTTVYKSEQYQVASHAHCTFHLFYFWHCTWETKINNR